MTDQPKPTQSPNSLPVLPTADALWEQAVTEQYHKGMKTYGTELHTNNGRWAAADCRAELVDAHAYLTQMEMEEWQARTALHELTGLHPENPLWFLVLSARRMIEDRDARIADLEAKLKEATDRADENWQGWMKAENEQMPKVRASEAGNGAVRGSAVVGG